MFAELEKMHGKMLVSRALGYLTISEYQPVSTGYFTVCVCVCVCKCLVSVCVCICVCASALSSFANHNHLPNATGIIEKIDVSVYVCVYVCACVYIGIYVSR